MSDELPVPHEKSWHDCCPWLGLFRTLGLALNLQLLLLATAGVLSSAAGWWLLGFLLFWEDGRAVAPDSDPAFQQTLDSQGYWPKLLVAGDIQPSDMVSAVVDGPVFGVWQSMSKPFIKVIWQGPVHITQFAYFVIGGLWNLLVWAFFGAAITRSAALQLTCGERPGLSQLLRFVARKLKSYFVAPLLPLLAILVIAFLMALFFGLFSRSNWTIVLPGALWGLALIGGFVMTLLLLGLFAGWPLMWATISTEGLDAFEGLSRAYTYTFQRPLNYLFYAAIAALLGVVGWFVVGLFADGVIRLTYWSASLGTEFMAGGDNYTPRIQQIQDVASGLDTTDSNALWAGAGMIGLWVGLVHMVAVAFAFSFFWTTATMIYLLLRHDADQVEMDEVYLEEQDETYGLPPLETDDAGVPGTVDEHTAIDESPLPDVGKASESDQTNGGGR